MPGKVRRAKRRTLWRLAMKWLKNLLPYNPSQKGKQEYKASNPSQRTAVPTLVQKVLMTKEYIPVELIDMVAKFKQKARERTQAWLVCLLDIRVESISLIGQEAQEMNITTHTALWQHLHGKSGGSR